MRVLVSGSRYWEDYKTLQVVLAGFNALYEQLTVIEGGAPGADQLAQLFVANRKRPGLELLTFPARWNVHDREGATPVKCQCAQGRKLCKLAGPRRNQLMIDEGRPAVLVSFKDNLHPHLANGGSEDMIKRAQQADLYVMHVDHGGPWPSAS